MAKTVQYWGTVNYQELPLTGRLVTWTPKQKQEVPDAIATLLLAAGVGFLLDNDNNGELAVYATDSSGNVTGLVGPGGGVIPLTGYYSDTNVNAIISGLALPTSGTIGVAAITSGVAYINNYRVAVVGTIPALTASKDNYIDLSQDGTYTVSTVTIAAAAPAIAVNSMRIGFITTGATTITSATQTGKDSLGNWMGNRTTKAAVVLGGLTNQSAAAGADTSINFGLPSTITAYGPEILDNQGVHSATTNSHSVPITVTGIYRIGAQCALGASAGATTLSIRKNANLTAGIPTASVTPSAPQTLAVGGVAQLNAGDFVYAKVNSTAGTALTEVHLYVCII